MKTLTTFWSQIQDHFSQIPLKKIFSEWWNAIDVVLAPAVAHTHFFGGILLAEMHFDDTFSQIFVKFFFRIPWFNILDVATVRFWGQS